MSENKQTGKQDHTTHQLRSEKKEANPKAIARQGTRQGTRHGSVRYEILPCGRIRILIRFLVGVFGPFVAQG